MTIKIKRVYEKAAAEDGYRVLVDRVWPRGLTKEEAHADLWLKDVAPTAELREWFGHRPERWSEFQQRYRRELDDRSELLERLRELERGHGTVTLLFGARDQERNQAVVLAEVLGMRRPKRAAGS